MKQIKFEELSLKNGWFRIILLAAAAFFLVINLFDVITFLSEKTLKYITAGCYLFIGLHQLSHFFYRNYVQWNKRGMMLRVNNFWGVNFGFADVREFEITENEYIIYTYTDKKKVVRLEGIAEDSRSRLENILRKHISQVGGRVTVAS